jgi:hypothetical protein
VEAIAHATEQPLTMFVIDLYPREGPRPTDVGSALSRKTDLLFANQTYLRLDAYRRELLLRKEIARLPHQSEPGSQSAIILLSYHPTADEAGSERPFDLSRDSAQQRWCSGESDMREALERMVAAQSGQDPLVILGRRDNPAPNPSRA